MPQYYRNLTFVGGVKLDVKYRRTDVDPITNDQPKDDFTLSRRNVLTPGFNEYEGELFYHDRRQINGRELIDLNAMLVDAFGTLLNFGAVKVIWLHNLNTNATANLLFAFKYERGNIGPDGERYIYEPSAAGIEGLTSSASADEGSLELISTEAIEYDIVLIGTGQEN